MKNFQKAPSQWHLRDLLEYCQKGGCSAEYTPGVWSPARPVGFYSWPERVKLAWKVFTGKADALVWGDEPNMVNFTCSPGFDEVSKTFVFQGQSIWGAYMNGEIDAINIEEAIVKLRRRGCFPTKVKPKKKD